MVQNPTRCVIRTHLHCPQHSPWHFSPMPLDNGDSRLPAGSNRVLRLSAPISISSRPSSAGRHPCETRSRVTSEVLAICTMRRSCDLARPDRGQRHSHRIALCRYGERDSDVFGHARGDRIDGRCLEIDSFHEARRRDVDDRQGRRRCHARPASALSRRSVRCAAWCAERTMRRSCGRSRSDQGPRR